MVEELEKLRDEELAERREKRKKTSEEDAAKKAADEAKKAAHGKSVSANAETKMEVNT